VGAVREKLGKISPFYRWGAVLLLLTIVLFYTANHIFILGWNVFTRSLFKILVVMLAASGLAAITLLVIGAADSSKRLDHRMEKGLREIKTFLKQFRIDKTKKKQKWGAIVLYIVTPVLLLFMIGLVVTFTEVCTPEFTIAIVIVVALIGIYLVYHESWTIFKEKIRYVQCRKCRSFGMFIFEKEPAVVKCGKCGYPELLDDGSEMEKRGFIRTQCNFCKRIVFTRKKTRKRLHCPYCRKIIYYD